MFHTSQIEISRKALATNVNFMKKLVGPRVEFCSVVKGNAYGHGIKIFVPLAESVGVRRFAVFSADEALEVLTSRSEDSAIMIMGAIDDPQIEWAVENEICFYIFDEHRLEVALKAAQKVGKPARIHLELETGMNRTGLEEKELRRVTRKLKRNASLWVLEGVATHLAGAESVSNYLRIRHQIERYHEGLGWLEKQGLYPKRRHIASSAAAFSYPETRLDMVRIGIAQYGYWPSAETKMHYLLENGAERRHIADPLKRIIRWTSKVMSVKDVGPGEFVNYGTSYLTTRRQKIAAVPVGYFHGYTRGLSNIGQVLLHGKRTQVIGTVNMNMLMVDVTDISGVEPGDEVVIIGRQKKMTISVASFADLTPFLNYEVLVRLPSEIPRKIVD